MLVMAQEQALLDDVRRKSYERHRVRLGAAHVLPADAGGIDHGDQLIHRAADRHAEAGEPDVVGIEVIVAMDRDGPALGETGAHAVGAATAFAPIRAGHEAGAAEYILQRRIGFLVEDNATRVRQQ